MAEHQNPRSEYKDVTKDLDVLGRKLIDLISEILTEKGIEAHAVTFRVKTEASAARKVSGNPKKYTGYESLTDVLGVRIICYFSNQVDEVARALEREFSIDLENSVDKRLALGDTQFGYMSVHHIATLLPARAKLVEYARFSKATFEVQIRSILQHAWAEIEHDLGYKVSKTIPSPLRRRFSMLAGVLELADREFVSLRNDVKEYEDEVAKEVVTNPDNLEINQSTLLALMAEDESFRRLDQEVAQAAGIRLSSKRNREYISWRITELQNLGVTDMATLRDFVATRSKHVVRFAKIWFERAEDREPALSLSPGIGLFYLGQSLRAESLDNGTFPAEETRHDSDEDLASAWARVVDELGPPQGDDIGR